MTGCFDKENHYTLLFLKRNFFVQTKKKKQTNVWVWLGVWGRKTVKITTYFITKDEKLCNSFFLFYALFFYSLLPLIIFVAVLHVLHDL